MTKKNHYNPCFWSAYWNTEYLLNKRNSIDNPKTARKTEIYSLKILGNKIVKQKTENVFYEKKAGLADLNDENMLDYCKRNFPDEFANFKMELVVNPINQILDFENYFTRFEFHYRPYLEGVIKNHNVNTIEEKTYLSFFLFTQILRKHSNWNDLIENFRRAGKAKFELFIEIRNSFTNTLELLNLLTPLLTSKWTLYQIEDWSLPLSDSPIIIEEDIIILTIAPDLVLELDKTKIRHEEDLVVNSTMDIVRIKEIESKIIKFSRREIISGDYQKLNGIMNSKIYKEYHT